MAADHGQSPDIDLDRTDRLPILEGISFDDDVADDAVRMDFSTTLPAPSAIPSAAEFIRGSTIDLPSLAESVRSVEERVARQTADYEALNRSYERARDAESSATLRANALERDLAGARTALEAEQSRTREHAKLLAERNDLTESARTRAEEALRERERYQTEARTLRDSLATRDATIVQVLHSLGERDAQLTALQLEHTRVQSALEARSQTSGQLESALSASRAEAAALELQLRAAREGSDSAATQLRRMESDLNSTRAELGLIKTQAGSYLELLRTRDWRSGFDQNLFRDMDAKLGVADSGSDALKAERDRLRAQVVQLETRISGQEASIDTLRAEIVGQANRFAQQTGELRQAEELAADFSTRLNVSENARLRLAEQIASREQALADANATSVAELRRISEKLSAAEQRVQSHAARTAELDSLHVAEIAQLRSAHLARLDELKTEAGERDEEIAVLVAHLQQARRPIEAIEAESKKLRDELATKTAAFDQISEEARTLRTTLERTRGALEEREFLIRRLEKSESNNANALGRIQTSMARLGAVTALPAVAPILEGESTGELIRIEGDRHIAHRLARRTRIGRAPGCEMQIDSSSVSRHHALILAGQRDAIIEDLNSTNGVIVNGRKVTRHLLHDGDVIIIGEIEFKYLAGGNKPGLPG